MAEINKMGFLTNLPEIGEEEIQAVIEVLKSKKLTLLEGAVTQKFEEEFARYVGTKHAIAVNSGTAAIHTVLSALNINKGDEVIVPPYTFVATVSPVLMQGAQPIFADIDLKTYNIDVEDAIRKIKPGKTKAIIPVHLFGQSSDLDPLMKICKEHD
ncbi:MAG: DegT/DnrJ/EryC1/StrS family aminotransferase, partial [Candidatus Helarchaeota archaeon]